LIEFGRRPLIMGIINMAPDSFAGDGLAGDAGAAEARGHEMGAAGADFLDVGGPSTHPGAPPLDVEEELRRTIPAVRRLAGHDLGAAVASPPDHEDQVVRDLSDGPGGRIRLPLGFRLGDPPQEGPDAGQGVLAHGQGLFELPRRSHHGLRHASSPLRPPHV
jgi:hypothetical protein